MSEPVCGYHYPQAYWVVAFGDKVGVVCDESCGANAVADIQADHNRDDGDEVGMDPVMTGEFKPEFDDQPFCMSCGKPVAVS